MNGPGDEPQTHHGSTHDADLPSAGTALHYPASEANFQLAPPACSGEGSAIPPDLVGHPRYLVLGRVGAGAMGEVYKAVHLRMDRVVALKVIHPRLVGDPAAAERFRQEVRAAARLSHPRIVAAYDADCAGGTHFLVMEFVEGVNLEELAARQGWLPANRACDYARQVALGLQHALERGTVHGDIKPHNLMLTPQGQVKVLDFGLARFASEATGWGGLAAPPAGPGSGVPERGGTGLTLSAPERPGSGWDSGPAHPAAGTPDYMAPEEAWGAGSADIRADIYSLGCTLYRFLAGRVPFPGGSALNKLKRHRGEVPEPLSKLRPELPARLVEAVARMMAKDPADRYQTPAEAARALSAFLAPGQHRVLVVEDDNAAREALALVLEAEGFAAIRAANGQEALDVLRVGPPPGLILLDLAMPVMDGWEFLRHRERDPALAAIPVVVVSAADPGQVRAAALGAAGYLQKPLDPGETADRVREHLTQGSGGRTGWGGMS